MQPYFFPYLGYWQLINAVDTFVIYDDVNFIKKGYINRNSILINSTPHRITLELTGASQNKRINEIIVGGNSVKILKTIETNYKKSPHFEDVFSLLKKVLDQKEKNLAKFLGNSIEMINRYLDISTNVIYSSTLEKNDSLKGQEKILDICTTLDAKQYINPIGGQELYDKKDFNEKEIQLNFIKMKNIVYKQFSNDFIPNLSIIDVLMFNDKDSIKKMLLEYDLI